MLDNSSVFRLQPSTTAPALARRALRKVANDHVSADVADTAELLTSELVTNAVTHGAGVVTLAIAQRGLGLQVWVGDEAPDTPEVQPDRPFSVGGRGLRMVDTLAAEWGVEPRADGGGKDVWFRLP